MRILTAQEDRAHPHSAGRACAPSQRRNSLTTTRARPLLYARGSTPDRAQRAQLPLVCGPCGAHRAQLTMQGRAEFAWGFSLLTAQDSNFSPREKCASAALCAGKHDLSRGKSVIVRVETSTRGKSDCRIMRGESGAREMYSGC